MKGNIDTLGILWMVYGFLQMGIGLLLALIYGGMGGLLGVIGASEGDEEALVIGGVFFFVAVVVAGLVFIMALLPVVTGVGLRKRAPWSRIAAFICAALSVMNIPLGTLIGVFTFVTLSKPEAALEFQRD